MNHALTVRSRVAAAAILPFRLAAATGTAEGTRQAAASTDKLLGVVDEVGAAAAGQTVDIQMGGYADVMAGGAFADGDPLTTDANGRAVLATKPGSGVLTFVAGFARAPATAAGDIVPMLVAPSVIAG